MSGQVIEFKARKKEQGETVEERQKEYFTKMKSTYMTMNQLEVDNFESVDQMLERIKKLNEQGAEIVFQTEEQAMTMAAVILDQPEYEGISHFNIVPCISRLSMFYRLVPEPKSEIGYIFTDQDMIHTINLEMMGRVALEAAQEKDDIN